VSFPDTTEIMGQRIEVQAIVLGEIAVFDTDRSITGQDGHGFTRDSEANGDFAARLAARLFEADEAIGHVFIASSQVVARRDPEWDDAAVERAVAEIRDLFVFYGSPPEANAPSRTVTTDPGDRY
jgi:hypothetical protein